MFSGVFTRGSRIVELQEPKVKTDCKVGNKDA